MPLTETTEQKDNLDVEATGERLLKPVTILSGNTVSRGMIVSFDGTATTKYIQYTDGDEPETVMYEDVDASAGDVVGLAYRRADLKASEVDFNDGSDTDAVRNVLDAKGIYLRD